MFVSGLSSASLTSNSNSNNNMVVESFNVQSNANFDYFSLVAPHAFPSDKGENLGGGSIVDDELLIVVNSASSDAYIASVPVLRNCKLLTGRYTVLILTFGIAVTIPSLTLMIMT